MAEVIRAAEMGMCFGVRDALAAARAVAEPRRVTVWGELVHNPEVSAELDARGFRTRGEDARTLPPDTPEVLITAHGVSDRERRRLEAAGARLIDTTCPLVRWVHAEARRLAAEGRLVVVLGRKDHVEVRGIVGDLERFAVVAGEDDVTDFAAARIGVVCQSTTRPEVAARLVHAICARNPASDVAFADTICGPTRKRQEAAEELLGRVDALVVVGGAHSNNTRELAALATRRGLPVRHVCGPADVDPAWVGRFEVIGLTAGTSTLDATIDAVERALRAAPGRRPAPGAGVPGPGVPGEGVPAAGSR